MRTLLTAVLGLSLAACTVGVGDDGVGDDVIGDDGGDDAPPPVPRVAVTVTPPTVVTDVELGTELQFSIDVTASGGFSGALTLAAAGVPGSWLSELTPGATVNLVVDGTATATLRVTIPSNGEATPATIDVDYSSALGADRAPGATVTVLDQFTDTVAVNGTACGYPMQFGAPVTINNRRQLRVGTRYRILNGGAIPMRIHVADGVAGFTHQPSPMNPGQTYDRTIGGAGTAEWYCHEDPGTATDPGGHPYIQAQ